MFSVYFSYFENPNSLFEHLQNANSLLNRAITKWLRNSMKVTYYITGYKRVWQTKIIWHLTKLTYNCFMKTNYIREIVHIWLQESLATKPLQNKLIFSVTEKFEKWLYNSLKVIYYINCYKKVWQTKIIWNLAKFFGNCFQKTSHILKKCSYTVTRKFSPKPFYTS